MGTRRYTGQLAAAAAALTAIGAVVFGSSATQAGAPVQIPVSAAATTSDAPTDTGPEQVAPQRATARGGSAAAFTDEQENLRNLLPAGYGPDSCEDAPNPPKAAVAVLDCFNNSSPGGPQTARYAQYPNLQTLDAKFTGTINSQVNPTCPDGTTSPGTWVFEENAPAAGRLLCGSNNKTGLQEVCWTENAVLLMGCADGPDLNALYEWWLGVPSAAGATKLRAR